MSPRGLGKMSPRGREKIPKKRQPLAAPLGRPENDGCCNVWYAVLQAAPELSVEFVPVHYEHERLVHEMRREKLPEEFVATVLTGWWTTCLEVLPAKERRRGRN